MPRLRATCLCLSNVLGILLQVDKAERNRDRKLDEPCCGVSSRKSIACEVAVEEEAGAVVLNSTMSRDFD